MKKLCLCLSIIMLLFVALTGCANQNEFTTSYIPENADKQLLELAKSGATDQKIQPIQINDMSEQGIFEILKAEAKLNLPDNTVFETDGKVNFIHDMTQGVGDLRIKYSLLMTYYNKPDAEKLLEELENSSFWNEFSLYENDKNQETYTAYYTENLKKVLEKTSNDEYYFYVKISTPITSTKAHSLGVLIIPIENADKYLIVFEGDTQNRTFRNGTVTIK